MPRIGRGIPNFGPRLPQAFATSKLGNATGGGSTASVASNSALASSIIPAQTVTVDSIFAWVSNPASATQPLVFAIYSDTNGLPGTLLASISVSQASIGSSAAFFGGSITPLTLTAGTRYWIVLSSATPGSNSYTAFFTVATNAALTPPGPILLADTGSTSGPWTFHPGALTAYVQSDAEQTTAMLGPHPGVGGQVSFNGYYHPRQGQIGVSCTAVARARNAHAYFPAQWYEGSETDATVGGVRPSPSSIVVYPERALGPDPPAVVSTILPPAPPIQVNTAIDLLRRRNMLRRFPWQGWEQEPCNLAASQAINNDFVSGTSTGGINTFGDGSTIQVAQKFARLTGKPFVAFAQIEVFAGTPTDGVVATIQSDSGGLPSGTVLATSEVVPAASIPGTGLGAHTPQTAFYFSPPVDVVGPVWLVLSRSGAQDAVNNYAAFERTGNGAGATADGSAARFTSGAWAAIPTATFSAVVQFATTTNVIPLQRRFLGIRPPSVLLPLPTPSQQTPGISFTNAVTQRAQAQRRFPLQGWEQVPSMAGVVVFDNGTDGGNTLLFSHVVGSGVNGYLTVSVALASSTVFSNSVTYAGVPMTLLHREVNVGFNVTTELWGLLAPASGSNPVVITLNGATPGVGVGAASFFGVDQADPTDGSALGASGSGSGTATSQPKTGSPGDMLVDGIGATGGPWNSSNGTIAWQDGGGEGQQYLPATGSPQTLTWTQSPGTPNWVEVIALLNAASVGQIVLAQRFLGPRPPLVVAPAPPVVTTITVKSLPQAIVLREQAQQRAPKSRLFPVPTLAQPPPVRPITVTLASQYRRQTEARRFPLQGWTVVAQEQTPVSFPTQGLLDSFIRANQGPPPSANWSGPLAIGDAGLSVAGNFLTADAVTESSAWWNTSFGNDNEAWITLGGSAAATTSPLIFVRVSNPGASNQTDYRASFNPITSTVIVNRDDANPASGPSPRLARVTGVSLPAGSVCGLRIVGSTITVWVNGQLICTVNDSTYPTGGFIGVLLFAGGTAGPFGGGTVTLPNGQSPLQSVMVQPRLGPRRPLIVLGFPTSSQQTITTAKWVSQQRRQTDSRRFPLQGWEGWGAVDALSGFTLSAPRTPPGTTVAAVGSTATFTARGIAITGYAGLLDYVQVIVGIAAGAPTDNVVLQLQTDAGGFPSGTVLAQTSVAGPSLSNALPYSLLRLPFQAEISPTTTLWLVVSRSGAADAANFYGVLLGATTQNDAVFNGSSWSSVATHLYYEVGYEALPGSRSFHGYQRLLGPRPPLLILPLPTETTINVPTGTSMQAVAARVARQQRAPHSDLFGFIPQVSAQPPPPIQTTLVAADRIERRHFNSFLSPPTVLQTFAGPQVTLVHTRPRRFATKYVTPATLEPEAVSLAEREIRVVLARARPRHTLGTKLSYVVYPATSDITVAVVRTRPRPTHVALRGLIFYAVADTTIFVQNVRTRPRPTTKFLLPPATLQPYAVTVAEDTVRVALARIRPRPTTKRIGPPTVLQTFAGPRTPLVRTRPRPTTRFLAPPATLQPYSVTVAEDTIRVALVRTRPRHTVGTKLGYTVYPQTTAITTKLVQTRPRPTTRRLSYVVYPQTGVGFTHLVKTRPRPTSKFVAPPATLQPYVVTIAEDTVRVVLARTRPRPTTRRLNPPTVLQVFSAPTTPFVRTRPRPTAKRLAAVTYPATSAITVVLTRTRPRPTKRTLGPLIFYAQTSEIQVTLVRTRPRRTNAAIRPPAITAVAQAFYGPAVALARTRPRHVVSKLSPPVFYAATSEIQVTTVRTRPRPTRHALTAITYPQTGVGFQHLVRTRPRPTTRFLLPPATLEPEPVALAEREIRVVLTRTRPRPTSKRIEPPTVLQVFTGPETFLVKTRPRPTTRRLGALIFYAQAGVGFTHLVKTRPRPTTRFLAPPATLQPYVVTLAEDTVRVALVHTRPRHTLGTRLGYTVYPATSEIVVALARIRPRPTTHRLTAVTYPATSDISVAVVRTRPRPTTKFIAPPATLQPYAVTVAENTIRVALVRIRPRHTLGTSLVPPTVLQTFFGPLVTLVKTRPRPTVKRILPPTAIRVPSVEQREDTITVALVRTRPRPTEKFIIPPLVKTFPPVVTTITSWLVAVPARRNWAIRFSWNGYEAVHGPIANASSEFEGNKRRGDHNYRLGPRRPQIIRGLPFLREQTVRVTRVKTRPRRTISKLAPPTTLQTFGPPVEVEIAVRTPVEDRAHRRARSFQIQPVTYAATSEITTALVRTRPRHTLGTSLGAPTVLRVFAGPTAPLVKTRPRPTISVVQPPATLEPESVAIAEREERVTLVRTRPRATRSFLRPPVAVRVFAAEPILVSTVKTRPRPQTARVAPPTRLRPPETTVRAHITRIRPARTRVALAPPTVVSEPPVVTTITTRLVTTQPRPTRHLLAPPTVVAEPPVVTTITAKLVRTRPRPTRHLLPPVVIEAEPPVVTTITTKLVETRPRATRYTLRPPATLRRVVVAFIASPILVKTVVTRPRKTHAIRVTPFPFFPGRDGFTTSTLIPSASAADSTVVVSGGAVGTVSGDSAESSVVASSGADIDDAPTDAGEIIDQPGGLT